MTIDPKASTTPIATNIEGMIKARLDNRTACFISSLLLSFSSIAFRFDIVLNRDRFEEEIHQSTNLVNPSDRDENRLHVFDNALK